jgi:hypothetical protein
MVIRKQAEVVFSLRDGGLLRGRAAVLPLDCKREFTSRAALIRGSNSRRELLDEGLD